MGKQVHVNNKRVQQIWTGYYEIDRSKMDRRWWTKDNIWRNHLVHRSWGTPQRPISSRASRQCLIEWNTVNDRFISARFFLSLFAKTNNKYTENTTKLMKQTKQIKIPLWTEVAKIPKYDILNSNRRRECKSWKCKLRVMGRDRGNRHHEWKWNEVSGNVRLLKY